MNQIKNKNSNNVSIIFPVKVLSIIIAIPIGSSNVVIFTILKQKNVIIVKAKFCSSNIGNLKRPEIRALVQKLDGLKTIITLFN